jgi:26S proteasome regulatory subunit T6
MPGLAVAPTLPSLGAAVPPKSHGGVTSYFQSKIEAAELTINAKTQNLRRLEAQRNTLNARGELQICNPIE